MPGSSKGAGVEVMVGVEVGGRVEVLVALGRGEEKGLGADVGVEEAVAEAAGDERIFVGLAEGIAIYGLIIAIMILGKI